MVTPADTARPLEPQLLRPGVLARLVGAPPAAVVFGGTIGLSAFLLFTAEPMVARLAQPVFGGAPAVWATVLVFFQVMLLLGYAYAHVVATRLAARPAALLHVSIAAVAAVLTIAAPRSVAGLVDPGIPTIPNVLLVLLAVAGPATFVMTSTTPLVSSWYARERPRGTRRRPSRPLLAVRAEQLRQPRVPARVPVPDRTPDRPVGAARGVDRRLRAPRRLPRRWPRSGSAPRRPSLGVGSRRQPRARSPSIAARRRVRWILLAAIPSGMLAAVTNSHHDRSPERPAAVGRSRSRSTSARSSSRSRSVARRALPRRSSRSPRRP